MKEANYSLGFGFSCSVLIITRNNVATVPGIRNRSAVYYFILSALSF